MFTNCNEGELIAEVDLKECELVEILKLSGGAKLIIKRLPIECEVDCTFEDCEEGNAEYITIAVSRSDYIAYACQLHMDCIYKLIAEEVPFDRE